MKMMEGLATSSTAMVSRLRCSTLSPVLPGSPTRDPARLSNSTRPCTCSLVYKLSVFFCLCLTEGVVKPASLTAGRTLGLSIHLVTS